jgi:hypothetical protein
MIEHDYAEEFDKLEGHSDWNGDAIRKAYLDGYADALKNYGIWQSGTQVIGCQNKSVQQLIQELKTQVITIRY